MVPARIPLTLDPARCDRCGRCMQACESGALKVGVSYIYVDWRSCTGCMKCAKACEREAIRPRESARQAPARQAASGATTARRTTGRRTAADPAPTRRAPTRRTAARPVVEPPAWTLLEAWALLVVLVMTFVVKDAAMTSAAVRSLGEEAAVTVRVLVLFGFYSVQAGALWLLALRRGVGLLDAYRLRMHDVPWQERLGSAAFVVLLLVAVRVGGWVYGLTAQALGWDPPMREIADLTELFGPTVWGLLISVALVVVIAPVVEEVVFRGVLQGAFVGRWGRRVGIGIAAGVFALYHFTPWMFVPLFALGVACGWLAETRRSLLPAISLHGAYNVIPVVIAFYLVW